MDMTNGLPDGFDFKAWHRDHNKHTRSIEQQRDALKSYLPALQRLVQSQTSPLAADVALVQDCLRFTLAYISHALVEETLLRMQANEADTPSNPTDILDAELDDDCPECGGPCP